MDDLNQRELQPDEMIVNVYGVDTVRKIDYIERQRGGGGIKIPVVHDGELLLRFMDGSVRIIEGVLDRY